MEKTSARNYPLEDIDRETLFHPVTSIADHLKKGPLIVNDARGVRMKDQKGRDIIDCGAGLWCVNIGYGRKELAKAAEKSVQDLAYYHLFGGASNEPIIRLAERVLQLFHDKADAKHLSKVFFGCSGSDANDTNYKLVRYYNNLRGKPQKKKFIARNGGYHGLTYAAASLTGIPAYHRAWDLPMEGVIHTSCPHYYRFSNPGESEEAFTNRMIAEIEGIIAREGGDTIAAFIAEPIMGTGGVLLPPKGYFAKLQPLLAKHDILLIVDEVITGFGRTGTTFACERFQITPDILVLSKQITSSYLPLAAILMTDQIYQGLADNTARIGTFGHGFTTSGHPVATAVALENLKIMEERGLMEHARRMEPLFQQGLRRFADHPLVGEARGVGMIGAVELVADKATKRQFDPIGKVGAYLYERGHHHGLIVRNIQDNVAMCPPLIMQPAEMEEMFRRFSLALDDTWEWVQANGLRG